MNTWQMTSATKFMMISSLDLYKNTNYAQKHNSNPALYLSNTTGPS